MNADDLALPIRVIALVVWVVLVIRYLPSIRLLSARLMVMLLLLANGCLVVGGLAASGYVAGADARTLYTAFSAAASLTALVLISELGHGR